MPATAVVRGMKLTAREKQILAGIAHGASNSEIGKHLNISSYTVATYVRSILRKIGARNRCQAITIGFVRGYLILPANEKDEPGVTP